MFLRISQSAVVMVMLDSINRAISKMSEAGVAGWAMATVCKMLLLAQSTYLSWFGFARVGGKEGVRGSLNCTFQSAGDSS